MNEKVCLSPDCSVAVMLVLLAVMCSGARATTLKTDSLRLPVPARGASTARGDEGWSEAVGLRRTSSNGTAHAPAGAIDLFRRTHSLPLDGSENTAGRLPFLGSETTRVCASERAQHLRIKSLALAVAAERKLERAAETGAAGLSRVASAPVTEDEKRAKRIPLGVYTGEESRQAQPRLSAPARRRVARELAQQDMRQRGARIFRLAVILKAAHMRELMQPMYD